MSIEAFLEALKGSTTFDWIIYIGTLLVIIVGIVMLIEHIRNTLRKRKENKMEDPKQDLIDAKFFEEESKALTRALVITISIVVGALAVVISRIRRDKGE